MGQRGNSDPTDSNADHHDDEPPLPLANTGGHDPRASDDDAVHDADAKDVRDTDLSPAAAHPEQGCVANLDAAESQPAPPPPHLLTPPKHSRYSQGIDRPPVHHLVKECRILHVVWGHPSSTIVSGLLCHSPHLTDDARQLFVSSDVICGTGWQILHWRVLIRASRQPLGATPTAPPPSGEALGRHLHVADPTGSVGLLDAVRAQVLVRPYEGVRAVA